MRRLQGPSAALPVKQVPGMPTAPLAFEEMLGSVCDSLGHVKETIVRLSTTVSQLSERHKLEVTLATVALRQENKKLTSRLQHIRSSLETGSEVAEFGVSGGNSNARVDRNEAEAPRMGMSRVTKPAPVELSTAGDCDVETQKGPGTSPLAHSRAMLEQLSPAAEPSEPEDPDDLQMVCGEGTLGHEAMVELHPAWERNTLRSSRSHLMLGGNQLQNLRAAWTSRSSTPRSKSGIGRLFTNMSLDKTWFESHSSRNMSGGRVSGESRMTQQLNWCNTTFVVKPTSTTRLLWDLAGMCFIGYDLIVVPLTFFSLPDNIFLDIMSWTSTIFWTLDVPNSFLVGFHTNEGLVETRLAKIARRYMRSWFTFDVLVVSIDWVATLLEKLNSEASEADNVGIMRVGRAARFMRLLRLLRLLKVHAKLAEIFDHIQSEFYRIMLGIIELIVCIVLANHVIACGFYGISYIHKEERHSWVRHFDILERPLSYRYFTSLHWSLTQFTPASMEIVPRNALERAYTVATLLLAMITFSSFVSSLTNAMTRLRTLNSAVAQQRSVLRRYLRDNDVSISVSARIWGWLQAHSQKTKRWLHEEDVQIIAMLPSMLQDEIRDKCYMLFLCVHPLFSALCDTYGREVLHQVYRCLLETSLPIGKDLFVIGEIARSMYFVRSGMLKYIPKGPEVRLGREFDTFVGQPDDIVIAALEKKLEYALETNVPWICENALWIKWKHSSKVIAAEHTELLELCADKFQQAFSRHKDIWQVTKYAKVWASYVREGEIIYGDYIKDKDIVLDMTLQAFDESGGDGEDASGVLAESELSRPSET